MKIYLYPNNKAYSEDFPRKCIGTNETFSIPEKRTVPYGGSIDDAEIFSVGNDTVIAFYTDENLSGRQKYIKDLKRYGKEYFQKAKAKSRSFREVGLRTL